ncbi:hypothetical protein [Ruegeria atlantica]|uniref:hypothetical protein n=1 Tax=Ruegeria atlantica TaxID=81569 RepID=UPI00147D4CB7|nr:hypothetical protein [Ruegeria atlantica]
MTTMVCWKSVDQNKRQTLNLCSDSRFGDDAGNVWDCGKKLFFSKVFPDVFGFVGEALPPQTALAQLIDAIDTKSLGARSPDPALRVSKYKSYLDATIGSFPKTRSVEIVYATRDDRQNSLPLQIFSIFFAPGKGAGKTTAIQTGGAQSMLIRAFGTDENDFMKMYAAVHAKQQGYMSRAVYWAFIDHLASGADKFTGGSPQIVRLGSAGPASAVGISHNGNRYLLGFELDASQLGETEVKDWHDELYQYVDPVSAQPRSKAQRIARPR